MEDVNPRDWVVKDEILLLDDFSTKGWNMREARQDCTEIVNSEARM